MRERHVEKNELCEEFAARLVEMFNDFGDAGAHETCMTRSLFTLGVARCVLHEGVSEICKDTIQALVGRAWEDMCQIDREARDG